MSKKRRQSVARLTTVGSSGVPDTVANQVFLGVPWKAVRPRYERVVERLKGKSPISFVIVGRNGRQDAEDLFEVIKDRIAASSYAIFDATGGNANVSLEYGYAEARNVPRALYLSTHEATRKDSSDAPIIADLAGKRRNQYKLEKALSKLLRSFSREHAYSVRFERFLSKSFQSRRGGEKKRKRALALKVIHTLDGVQEVRRADIVQRLQADNSRYTEDEIDDMIKRLHKAKLIRSQQGPHSRVHIA
jgi:hypothetical protein